MTKDDMVASPRKTLTLFVIFFLPLAGLYLFSDPIRQSLEYLNFADKRSFFAIKNFGDVLSNLIFCVVGLLGLVCQYKHKITTDHIWSLFFVGIFLIGPGSAYFHYNPSESTLVWDRLPMGVAFLSLFAALLLDTFSLNRHAAKLILPCLLLGSLSTIHWYLTEDLRVNIWVQVLPILAAIFIPLMFKSKLIRASYLLGAAFFYILAKICEFYDYQIFYMSGFSVSGHTLKHLLAGMAIYQIVKMYEVRFTKNFSSP